MTNGQRTVQSEVFSTGEGDRWFERNKAVLHRYDTDDDIPLRLLKMYGIRPTTAVEIGGSNGYRMAALQSTFGARTCVVEVSSAAIEDGKSQYPGVRFCQASSDCIPLEEQFDLVVVNFVFHWIDRSLLLRSVAEIDRLVCPGGCLMIGDFFPSNKLKVRYHHLQDQLVFTYKQNYAAIFIQSGLYHPICMLSSGHSGKALAVVANENERVSHWLLRKSGEDLYIES